MNLFDLRDDLCFKQWNKNSYTRIPKEEADKLIKKHKETGIFDFLKSKYLFSFQFKTDFTGVLDSNSNLFAIWDPGTGGTCPNCQSDEYFLFVDNEHKKIDDPDCCCYIPTLESLMLLTKDPETMELVIFANSVVAIEMKEIEEDKHGVVNNNIFTCGKCGHEGKFAYNDITGLYIE